MQTCGLIWLSNVRINIKNDFIVWLFIVIKRL